MRTSVALQLLGPVSLFGVMAIAEVAAYALNCAPSSEWLWYFNLKWYLHCSNRATMHWMRLSAAVAQILVVGTPLLILAGLGVAYRRTLLLATSSNLYARLRRVCSLELGPGEGAAPGLTVGSICCIDEFRS